MSDFGDFSNVVGLVGGFIAQAFVLLAGIAVAWGKIKSEVRQLTGSIKGLTRSVEKLDDKLDSHAERLARLEAQR